MDAAIAPLLLLCFGVALWGTWTELRNSVQPATCSECPHCRALLVARQREAEEEEKRRAEVRSWPVTRGVDDEDERRRRRTD